MCGVAGFLAADGLQSGASDVLEGMTRRLVHRGPDERGAWTDAAAGVALGHRRLSILDLSSAGSQPMHSHSGRYVLVTNGEIYNHLDTRAALAAEGVEPAWRGHSDTETMLAAFDRWGIEAALQRFVGMFAFAAWDRQERRLTLARDRLGEKPLYYGRHGGTLLFGSELKALRAHPDCPASIDREQVATYLHRGYVPAPRSIYAGILKLPPGCLLQVGARPESGELPAPRAYWSLAQAADRGRERPFRGSDGDAVESLEQALARAVASQSVADVPLGAFLSGGIDSSTVVALMQKQSSKRVKTFAIGFEEDRFNEAPHARAVARHLGTDHTELIVTPREAMTAIQRLPSLYDEPFGDSSSIPTFLVAELARRDVTVSLSGDGGDELFGGYTRYGRAQRLWSLLRFLPPAGRKLVSTGVGGYLSRFIRSASPGALYDEVMLDPGATGLVAGVPGRPASASIGLVDPPGGRSFYEAMMVADGMTYLPDDILVKVDRASMGVSLESRVPFHDHRVVELAWTLPFHLKRRGGEGKWLLRRLLEKHVPAELLDRPKQGFGMPVGDWIRGPLREWAESLLDAAALAREGTFDAARVRERWRMHLNGETRSGEGLWRILMFRAWQAEAHPR
jgi:asparagine synthase (glutamine-hydrolysing)